MPKLSEFFGIIVILHHFDADRHNLPHIHAAYAEWRAVFGIEHGDVLAGELPGKQRRLMERWIEEHRAELFDCWRLAVRGEPFPAIAPLTRK